jgi:hypothetical protein
MASWIGTGASNPGDVATNGKVGIGTTTPVGKLEVYDGDLRLRKTDSYPQFQLFNYSHDNVNLCMDAYYDGGWKSSDSGSNFLITKVNDKLRIMYASGVAQGGTIGAWNSANSNNALVVDTNGNVGIGTYAPSVKLDVRGGAVFNEDGGDNDFRIEGSTDTHLLFVDAGNDRIGIGSDLGSGLGGVKLNAHADTGGHAAIAAYGPGVSPPYAVLGKETQALYGIAGGSDTVAHLYHTSATGKALIIQQGNVGIGTTSPSSKLSVDNGDIEVEDSAKGLILRDANDSDKRYRIRIVSGALDISAV